MFVRVSRDEERPQNQEASNVADSSKCRFGCLLPLSIPCFTAASNRQPPQGWRGFSSLCIQAAFQNNGQTQRVHFIAGNLELMLWFSIWGTKAVSAQENYAKVAFAILVAQGRESRLVAVLGKDTRKMLWETEKVLGWQEISKVCQSVEKHCRSC